MKLRKWKFRLLPDIYFICEIIYTEHQKNFFSVRFINLLQSPNSDGRSPIILGLLNLDRSVWENEYRTI